jgi:hypothetical protein
MFKFILSKNSTEDVTGTANAGGAIRKEETPTAKQNRTRMSCFVKHWDMVGCGCLLLEGGTGKTVSFR